ncbi:hypothetical protein PHAVU_L003137 [Phaseolus vulgaris]|uniref:DUF1664 domain-containing protein n=2 Tax=Phaseolus vulgaris TaxID=3885 RepID=T2DP89_PHAVU|nr:hypothetical protein PHAVU_006G009300g [Phaseolus vulgaris]AGV54759.1 hypothetical protein [Phaseolus vulgaris]ESW18054.1 hypothetical protein PHAVU_006G009300g [Phaseolus vulgaris]
MALQAGVNTSKVLILVGAGLSGSVLLRSGQLSGLIAQLQELLKGVDDAEILPGRYDAALIAAQIRQLAQEIRELTLSHPVTIFNANSSSSGGISSYLLPAAAIGAMGYCYMWWKGWSFSDVMFVTKRNMVNAVEIVSKQLENVHETLASTKRHLTKRLEGLDLKLEEHNELGQLISDDVKGVKSNLSQIGFDIEVIRNMISGLEGKLELVEGKQDMTNSGLWYLCQFADGFNDRPNGYKDIAEPTTCTVTTLEKKALKGLQFIATTGDTSENSSIITKKVGLISSNDKEPASKQRIHRSFPLGISVSKGLTGLVSD